MFQPNRGVTTPVNQGAPANAGTPNTVVNAMRASFVVVEYYDGNGRLVHDTLLEAGGNFYSPPNSVAWTAELGRKGVSKWLAEGIAKRLPVDGEVKVADTVDVVGG